MQNERGKLEFVGDPAHREAAVELVEESLRRHGDLGAYGDLRAGLQDILKTQRVEISEDGSALKVNIVHPSNTGDELIFRIDKDTLQIRDLVVARIEPPPDFKYAPTGTLRAVFIASNPVQAVADPKTGEVSGPAAAIAEELARRFHVPLRSTGVPGAAGVIEAMKKGEAEIGFLAFDPARAAELDFSRTYALAQNTYAVLERSPLRSVADVDRAGVRIGVATRDAGDLFLTRTLKQAALKRNPGGDLDKAVQMLRAGEIDAYAANRQRLSELAARMPDLRLFPDNFYAVEQAIVVAKGQSELLEQVNRALESVRTSGLLAKAIERAGLKGVDVAP